MTEHKTCLHCGGYVFKETTEHLNSIISSQCVKCSTKNKTVLVNYLTQQKVLCYIDCPQLVIASNQIDQEFLCILIDNNEEFSIWLCAPIPSGFCEMQGEERALYYNSCDLLFIARSNGMLNETITEECIGDIFKHLVSEELLIDNSIFQGTK